ncbi:MAG: LysR family transcriptional regulator [Eubacterium sp.]|nr:LysR family transcriptional regulator [Eubacterium sp.]
MTLRHLEIFIEVRRMESITKAANNLNLAQPAVSRAIRELESFYGTQLFERMNRKLYVSPAGEQLFLYANSIISQFYEAKDVLTDHNYATKIRIGSNISCGQSLVPKLLKSFGTAFPDIPVYLKVSNSKEIEEALLLNELDFAFMDTPKKTEYFYSQKICEDQMLMLGAADSPISSLTLDQLSAIPLLVRESGSGSRQMVDRLFAQNGTPPVIAMESSNVYSLKEMCRAGFGILILTQCMADSWPDRSGLKEIHLQGQCLSRSYCFVYHKSKYLTKSMKHFLHFAAKNVKGSCPRTDKKTSAV